ncbi:MAG: DUF4493 domain-containing protein [Muribaculaceae bacterium]|nr:DUF4493 domain-containing protein [Muribaculaceae bacterium]MDE6754290.1 DUF4493 domain-containing protein [Muribaculaceae bacterium]
MKKITIYTACAGMLLLSACASEAPFEGPHDRAKGSFAKSALSLQVHTDHVIKQTRAEEIDINDIHIAFHDVNNHLISENNFFRYLPEVVMLESGNYYITAFYTKTGDDVLYAAAWDSPYYEGKSENFEIKPNEITSNLGTIKCVLKNVMTSVVFEDALKSQMSEDSYVEVKINENSPNSLNFTTAEDNGQHYGYFEINGEQTLVATFHGIINGAETVQTKTFSNVTGGNHYRITFKLHDYQGEESGNHTTGIDLDASVTKTDEDGNVSLVEEDLGDKPLDDNERPNENPENPDEPVVPADPISFTMLDGCYAQLGDAANIVKNIVKPGDIVGFIIDCPAGIKEFTVEIQSEQLNAAELEGVGLSANLDLVDPKDTKEALNGLGLLDGDTVRDKKNVKFAITNFIPMLAALGSSEEHTFILTIKDNNDVVISKYLTLVTE